MKKLLLILFGILISFQSFAQDPDPELFKTWYITEVMGDFLTWPVDTVIPRIDPTLTFTETLTFYGEAACNTYSGTMSYDGATNYFEILSFEQTNNVCDFDSHNNFEIFYLDAFIVGHSFSPWVDEINGIQKLYTIGPYYPLLAAQNISLSVVENDESKTTIFPNPTSDVLSITSEGIIVEKIKVYSISGKQVLEASGETNSIDVSGLSAGLYFLEVSTSEGKSVQKFIKN